MRQDYIHICIVLDASGSMSPMERETRQILKDFIYKEKQQPGKTVLDVYQFNSDVRHLLKSIDLSNVDNRFVDHYSCGGCTAMNDAICIAIDELGKKFSQMPECDRPADILVAILTDGEENSSVEYSFDKVKDMIKHQEEKYNWTFMYLGADISDGAYAQSYGFGTRLYSSKKSLSKSYDMINCVTANYRNFTGSTADRYDNFCLNISSSVASLNEDYEAETGNKITNND